MRDNNLILLSTLYVTLLFVLVSMSGTYSITGKLFGSLFKVQWPAGMDIKQPGFWVHVVVFAVLVALPMIVCKV
jgi:hypothetical protein